MIAPVLLFLSAQAVAPAATVAPTPALPDIEQAIDAGRLEQARLMAGRAIAGGVRGSQLDKVLADLAFASGKYDEALRRYQQLFGIAPGDSMLAERAGISALKLGKIDLAAVYITHATKPSNAS